MSDTVGSVLRRAALAACLALASVRPAFAQGPEIEGGVTTIPPAPAAPAFMSRYDFHLSAAALSTDDPRFVWDTHFGGDVDVIDYVAGRVRLVADYQAVLGNQLRPFDPNQGNYVLEPSISWRVAGFEVAATFHHESRHLSDRPKTESIDWNMLGGRVLKHIDVGATAVEVEGGVAFAVEHSFTDYDRAADLDVLVRRRFNSHVAAYARGTGVLYGVDGSIARDNQFGVRAEAGVRLIGTSGVIELFGGYQRSVDAYPTDRIPLDWPLVGFRFISR